MPVYLVKLKQTEPATRLIEAPNQSAAERFATHAWFSTSSGELVALGKAGVAIEAIPAATAPPANSDKGNT